MVAGGGNVTQRERILWKCTCGASLGVVVIYGVRGLHQLILYREAMPPDAAMDVDVLGLVTGEIEVRCSLCQRVRTWHEDVRLRRIAGQRH